jgi:hypothetical protein
MPRGVILLFIFGFAFLVLIVIIRVIAGAVRSTFSRASLIAVIVGVITSLLARSKVMKEERDTKEKSPTADERGDATWIACSYCGSKNKSSNTKCSNCGASL